MKCKCSSRTNARKTNLLPLIMYVGRHFMGEDLDSLNIKELQNLEHQIDSALKHVRSRKVMSVLELFDNLGPCY